MRDLPVEYVCELYEGDRLHERKVAKSLDDATVYLSDYRGALSENGEWRFEIHQCEVVG